MVDLNKLLTGNFVAGMYLFVKDEEALNFTIVISHGAIPNATGTILSLETFKMNYID